jgi:CxxC motif-containing protein (DUF1111 family)
MRRGFLLLALATAGCMVAPQELTAGRIGAVAAFGDVNNFVQPLPGLARDKLELYKRGRLLFDKTFSPAEGLGPLYNNTSCKACHGFPNSGGGSPELLVLIGAETDGVPRTLKEKGGPVISDHTLMGLALEQFPQDTKAISKRITPPTFGLGLLEAIPAADLTAQLAASPRKAELGIAGLANQDGGKLARFGWKAQTADMIQFTVTASNFEMGLSSPQRPYEFFPNMPPQQLASPAAYDANPAVKAFFDGRPDRKPDLSQAQVEELAAFQRYQAPPPPLPETAQARLGREAFGRIGCAECHAPAFTTGPNAIGVPPGLAVPVYSDLLLHDMGDALGDGINWQGRATGNMWRTTPLWGLRYKQRLIHDGRTNSVEEAIQWHGGEGAAAAAAYNQLDPVTRDALRAFLLSI